MQNPEDAAAGRQTDRQENHGRCQNSGMERKTEVCWENVKEMKYR